MWLTEINKVATVVVKVAGELCPNGYRLISNVGHDAMQSQSHAHVHILGGTFLGHYA